MATQTISTVPATRITLGSNTDTALMTMKNVATGSYVQSAKFDFGTAWHSRPYVARLVNKFGSAVAAGATCKLWIGFSTSGTAATDNCGACTGADGAYTGYSGGTAAQSLLQLLFIGQLNLDANAGPQDGRVGMFSPEARYGYIVWLNASGQTTTNVDADHQVKIDAADDRIEAPA